MNAAMLSDTPRYCFFPVHDPDAGVWQVRIVIDGMEAAIGTSLVALTSDIAMTVADKLNRPLGWTRESWTAFADGRPPGGSGGVTGGARS